MSMSTLLKKTWKYSGVIGGWKVVLGALPPTSIIYRYASIGAVKFAVTPVCGKKWILLLCMEYVQKHCAGKPILTFVI